MFGNVNIFIIILILNLICLNLRVVIVVEYIKYLESIVYVCIQNCAYLEFPVRMLLILLDMFRKPDLHPGSQLTH